MTKETSHYLVLMGRHQFVKGQHEQYQRPFGPTASSVTNFAFGSSSISPFITISTPVPSWHSTQALPAPSGLPVGPTGTLTLWMTVGVCSLPSAAKHPGSTAQQGHKYWVGRLSLSDTDVRYTGCHPVWGLAVPAARTTPLVWHIEAVVVPPFWSMTTATTTATTDSFVQHMHYRESLMYMRPVHWPHV